MSVISRGELNAALKELLGLRGGISLALDETIQPVILVGDLRELQSNWSTPWAAVGVIAGAAAERGWNIIENPDNSGEICTVEFIQASLGVAGSVRFYMGTINQDYPEPVLTGGVGSSTVVSTRIAPRSKGTPRIMGTSLILRFGRIATPGTAGIQIGYTRSAGGGAFEPAIWPWEPPRQVILPPGSWCGCYGNFDNAQVDSWWWGRLWPLG